MKHTFTIVIEKDIPVSLNSISTVFYVKLDEYCFPSHGWTDLSYNVLMMWIAEVFRNNPASQKRTLYFMDGPYSIEIIKKSTDSLVLRCVHQNICTYEGTCRCVDFLEGLVTGLTDFLKIVKNEYLHNPQFRSVVQDVECAVSQVQLELRRLGQ